MFYNYLFIFTLTVSYLTKLIKKKKKSKFLDFSTTLGHIKPTASVETQTRAVQDLIKRTIGDRASWFFITIDPNFVSEKSNEVFKVISYNQ